MKQLIINGAVRLLPTHLQARYAEQWQADLDGAAELGIKPWSLVLALAPRIRSSEELDAHENVETRALIS